MNTVTLSETETAKTSNTVAARFPASLPRDILVPIDFSQNSFHGLAYAVELAERLGARLTLVHVTEPAVPPLDGAWVPADAESHERARQQLAELAHDRAGRLEVVTEVRLGNPPDEIDEAARRHQSDLIIMSTHGYTGLKQVLLGGITEAVIRRAPCPVLVVRSHPVSEAARLASTQPAFRSLLVPIDFSPRSERAIAYAGALAQWSGGTVSLMHVLGPSEWDEIGGWTGGDFGGSSADVQARLHAVLTRLLPANVHGKVYAGPGTPFAQIVAGADFCRADLLVLTTHGRTGLAHLLCGSTAERILRHASSPVLIIPPDAP